MTEKESTEVSRLQLEAENERLRDAVEDYEVHISSHHQGNWPQKGCQMCTHLLNKHLQSSTSAETGRPPKEAGEEATHSAPAQACSDSARSKAEVEDAPTSTGKEAVAQIRAGPDRIRLEERSSDQIIPPPQVEAEDVPRRLKCGSDGKNPGPYCDCVVVEDCPYRSNGVEEGA